SYSFEGATTTGMYNDGSGGLGFAVGGNDALSVESDGTISVDTASYETLVLANNDVPNKKYVDDSIGAIALDSIITDADADTKVDVEEGADDDTIRMDVGDSSGTHGPLTDAFVLNATAMTVDLGTASSAVAGAPITITAGAAGGGSAAGGSVTLEGGSPSTSGDGGSVILNVKAGTGAGADGSVSFQRDGTEFLNFAAGSGLITVPDALGNDISLTAGTGTATGTGGAVAITAGAGGATEGDGGRVDITAGAGIDA
ncbi:unnamed protein product, partial [marine sediment metagenome]